MEIVNPLVLSELKIFVLGPLSCPRADVAQLYLIIQAHNLRGGFKAPSTQPLANSNRTVCSGRVANIKLDPELNARTLEHG